MVGYAKDIAGRKLGTINNLVEKIMRHIKMNLKNCVEYKK